MDKPKIRSKVTYHFKYGLLWCGMILTHINAPVVDDVDGRLLYRIEIIDIPYITFGFSEKGLMKRIEKAFDTIEIKED